MGKPRPDQTGDWFEVTQEEHRNQGMSWALLTETHPGTVVVGRCGHGFREWGKQWTMALVSEDGVEIADWATSGF